MYHNVSESFIFVSLSGLISNICILSFVSTNILPIFPSLVNNCLYKYCKYYYSLIRTDCCYNAAIVTLLVSSYVHNSDSCKTDIQTIFSISFRKYFPLPRLCNLSKAITVIDALELSERRYQRYLTSERKYIHNKKMFQVLPSKKY